MHSAVYCLTDLTYSKDSDVIPTHRKYKKIKCEKSWKKNVLQNSGFGEFVCIWVYKEW